MMMMNDDYNDDQNALDLVSSLSFVTYQPSIPFIGKIGIHLKLSTILEILFSNYVVFYVLFGDSGETLYGYLQN